MGLYLGPRWAGVRITKRGVRTSVGPRVARIHTGAGGTGISTGAGPVSYYQPLRGRRRRPAQGQQHQVTTRRRGGCLSTVLAITAIAVVFFWPFMFLHGAAAPAVGVPWLLVMAGLCVLGLVKRNRDKRTQAGHAPELQEDPEDGPADASQAS